MKKKILALSMCLLFSVVLLTGCGENSVNVNVENQSNLYATQMNNMIDIGGGLVYDESTRVVYIENYTCYDWNVYTAYFAPNGKPYRYNSETNTLIEIVE